jgi:hypothetical protein
MIARRQVWALVAWTAGTPTGHVVVQEAGSETRQGGGEGVADVVVVVVVMDELVRVVNVVDVVVMLVRVVDVVEDAAAQTTFESKQASTLAGVSPICGPRQVPALATPVASRMVRRTVLQLTTFVARFTAPPEAMAAHWAGRVVTQLGLAAGEVDAVVEEVNVELDCVAVPGDVDGEVELLDVAALLEDMAAPEDDV